MPPLRERYWGGDLSGDLTTMAPSKIIIDASKARSPILGYPDGTR
jgi:hypothetical protein